MHLCQSIGQDQKYRAKHENVFQIMKLLNLRLFKVCSSESIKNIGLLSVIRNSNAYSSPINLKCVRKCWTMTKYRTTVNTFRYEYDTGELLEKLKSLTNCTVISTADKYVEIEALLTNLKTQNFQSKEDVQALVTSLILAARLGQNVDSIIEKTFDVNALEKFLSLCDAWLDQMTAEDAVSTLVALNLLKVPLYHPVNRKLTIHVSHMLRGNFK